MAKKTDSWGIEVGSNAIKAMRLIREGSKVRLAEFEVLPFKKILTTPDLDVDEAIQVNLDQLMQRHDLTRGTIMVSVAGHMAFARFAKLPPVDPKKIPDIVKFEAVQQIPFPIEEVEWDYQVFAQADSPDVEVGIFAIMRERVMSFLENYRKAGLTVDGLTLSPLAVYNGLGYDMELSAESPATIFMDIGTTSTDVVVAESGHTWLRTLPMGGNNFTEALVRAFKLSFPKAEKLKREAATSKYARQIYVAMRPVFADLVQEIQRSLGYYQSLNRNANLTQLVGLGSTFRLPGLRKFLKQQLQLEVIRPDGFKRISVDGKRASDLAHHSLNLATVYGLAIQGLGLELVTANILPKNILKQRMWRSKQPWIAAAAALLIAATVAAAGKQWIDRGTFKNNRDANDSKVQSVIDRAQEKKQRWDQIEIKDSRQQIENLQRIPDYREVWPKILADLTDAFATLAPQSQLLGSDYEAVASIPRIERRRVLVQSIRSKYEGHPGTTYDEIWGGQGIDEDVDVSDEDEDLDADMMGTAMASRVPPSIVVTVTGTIPHKDGDIDLTRAMRRWLLQNAKRDERPYTIEPEVGDEGLMIRRVPDAGAAADGRRTSRPTVRDDRGSRPSRGDPRLGVLASQNDGRNVIGDTQFMGTSIDDILPWHPLANEARDTDWQFQMEWRFELKRPDDARTNEDAPARDEQPTEEDDPDLAMENRR